MFSITTQRKAQLQKSYRRVTEVTEATMYTDVQVRGLKKAVFRRLTSKLNIHMALDSKDDAKSALVELKKAFTAFQEAHDVVCAPITDFGEQMKEQQEFMDVELQYTQCLKDINPWLYGTNCDVSYAKPSLAINSSVVNARDTGKSQGDICGKQSICLLCHSVHPLYACGVFKKKSINQRLAFVAHNKLCCICFSKEHATINCPADIVCKKCSLNHSTYIHVDDVIVNKDVDVDVNTVTPVDIPTNSSGTTLASNSADDTPSSDYTFMPTVSVVVNESYKTHALLDSGSTNSFITSDAVKCFGLSGKTVIYRHTTVNTPCMTTSTKVVNFILYSLDGTESLSMSNVFVVEEVPYTYSHCRDLSIYPHLSDIPISPVHPPAKVDILIGQDNSDALVPLQVLKGNPGDPFSVLTKFGWTLNSVVPGISPDCVSLAVVSNFVHTSINAKVEVLSDTADDHVDPTLNSLSVSTDCKVLDICHGESIVVDSNVDVPIFREVSHVDNSLLTPAGEISILSDCDDDVKAIICKGLTEDIPVDEVKNHDPMTYYVPYHPVFKRSGDIYFLSDCSCSSQEYPFDDCVSHTLDSNLNNLSNFLLYRRQHEYAMSPDVLSMYNQVLLFHHSHIALSFLWDVNDSVVHHEMLVHPFGGVCNCTCPAVSLLHECTFSALDVVIQDVGLNLSFIYDCLLSIDSTEEMSNLVIQSESMLSNSCDFDPRKCLLYDPSMSRLIPDSNMSLDVDNIFAVHASQLVSEALGVAWVMPIKQWLSWFKPLDSWINNTCLVLCHTFVFDNG